MKKYVFFCFVFSYIVSSCAIEITKPGEIPFVDSIVISNKKSEFIVGDQHVFDVAYFPFDATPPEMYTWFSSDSAIASINQNGLFTANDEGEVNIRLTSVVPRKKGTIELSDEMTITVFPIEIEQIMLNKESLEMLNRSSTTLTYSFIPANVKPKEVEWTSGNHSIATVTDGVVTAHSAGNAIITVKVKGSNIEASCLVKVNPIVLTSIRFDTDNPLRWDTLEVKYSIIPGLIFVPDSAENKTVTYASSNSSIATVNANGVITGVSSGRAFITATSVVGGLRAEYRVQVLTVPELVKVSVEKIESYNNAGAFSGVINATLTNHSSKPVLIKLFRVLDRYNNIYLSYPINETLEPSESYEIKLIQLVGAERPEAVFTIQYESQDYRRAALIE